MSLPLTFTTWKLYSLVAGIGIATIVLILCRARKWQGNIGLRLLTAGVCFGVALFYQEKVDQVLVKYVAAMIALALLVLSAQTCILQGQSSCCVRWLIAGVLVFAAGSGIDAGLEWFTQKNNPGMIREGSTYEQVVQILGEPTYQGSNTVIDGQEALVFLWENDSQSVWAIFFKDSRLGNPLGGATRTLSDGTQTPLVYYPPEDIVPWVALGLLFSALVADGVYLLRKKKYEGDGIPF